MAISTATGLDYSDTSASSYVTNILQDLYLPAVADAVIYPNMLIKRIGRSSRRIEGKLVRFPVHYDDATGVSAIGAGGLLPDPDVERWAQYSFGVKHVYVRMKFDGVTKDATKTQMASWLDIIMYELQAKTKILQRARQRMIHNDGSGRLAETVSPTGGAYAATTYTVRINQGIESPATCTTTPTRWIKPNMIVAFIGVSGGPPSVGVIKAVAQVSAVTATTITILTPLSISGVVALGDWIVTASQVIAGLANRDTGFHNETMGIAGAVSDANPDSETSATDAYQGITRTTTANTWHRATVQANAGVLRPNTLATMDLAWTTLIEIGDTTATALVSNFGQVRKYAELLLADRRFVGQTEFDGGYKALAYNDVPLIADRDCYNNRIYFLDETDFMCNTMADPQWMKEDGAIWHRLEERDAYQGTLYMREQFSNDMSKKQLVITDLNE
jgi:hypothetical protein